MALTSTELSNSIAGTTTTDYLININLPSWTTNGTQPVDPDEETKKKQNQLYIMGGILIVLVLASLVLAARSVKKQKSK